MCPPKPVGACAWLFLRFAIELELKSSKSLISKKTKFQFCRVPRMDGIELQLLCGVRIELAIGSLPYLAQIPSRSLPIPLGGT